VALNEHPASIAGLKGRRDRHRIIARSERRQQHDGDNRAARPNQPPPPGEKPRSFTVLSHFS
jgi:hypothetical protein